MEEEKKGLGKFSQFFWIIFLIFAVIFARAINSGSNTSNNSSTIKKSAINNYEFIYSNSISNIYGKAYDNKYLFVFNNSEYYYNGEKTYLVLDHSLKEVAFDIGIIQITPSMVDELTDSSVSSDKSYYVPLYDFMNLYDVDVPVNGDEANKYNIAINKYYKDDNLYMIKLDLSNYYLFKGIDNTGVITIDLYNQGNVNDFSKEYEGLEVLK